MKPLHKIIYTLLLALLLAPAATAQRTRTLTLHRTFDYAFPAPADSTLEHVAHLDSTIILLPRQELAAVAKQYAATGHLEAAEIITNMLAERYPRYAYVGMLRAYIAQQRALFHAREFNERQDATQRTLAFSELAVAANELETLAEQARDSVETLRSMLLTAADMRYQAEQGDAARTDMARVLALRPSQDDSLDIAMMLADFDRMDSLYASALERYEHYYALRPTLGNTTYDRQIGAGYLNTLYTLGLHDTPTMKRLHQETDRYIQHAPMEPRYRRYKRQASYALALADSAQYNTDYYRSLDYVLLHELPDSLLDYDDHYAAADVARRTHQWDAYIAELRQCISLYEDPSVTRRQTMDEIFDYLTEALGGLERNEELALARRSYAEVKQRRLGDKYEPYYDQVNQGVAYFDAMKAAETDEAEALRLYALADSCFTAALQRAEAVDSLREKRRTVLSSYLYATHRTVLYNLHTPEAFDSCYQRATQFFAQKRAEYAADESNAETVADLTAYERNLTTIVADQAPDDSTRQRYFALAEKQLREAFLAAPEADRPTLLAQHYRLHVAQLMKALEREDNEASFLALQRGLDMLSQYEPDMGESYIIPYNRAQLCLTYDRRGDNLDAVEHYLKAAERAAEAPQKVQQTIYVYLSRYFYLEWGKTWDDRETRYQQEDIDNALQCKHFYTLLRQVSPDTDDINITRILNAIADEDLLWKRPEYQAQ